MSIVVYTAISRRYCGYRWVAQRDLATKGQTMTTATHYIVQTSRACMPNSCWGNYRRVAVLEVPVGVDHASMISARSRDVSSVAQAWERLNVGTTSRCAYQVALAEARVLAAALNA